MPLNLIARTAGLVAVWIAAVLLALGSSTFDDDDNDDEVLPPVTVQFDVTNGSQVRFSDGTTVDTTTSIRLAGSFEKGATSRITLRNIPVLLATSTAWTASVLPADADNLLVGEFTASVTDALEFGIDRQPAFGQIANEFDGTTTMVTFSSTGDAVTVQAGVATAQTLAFDDFRGAFSDTGRSLDLRMASKAYRVLENIWLITRISESLHREIEQQLSMLESVGLQTSLALTCDNAASMLQPSYVMRWLNDVVASGQAGNGDNFTANWRNCLLDTDDRYLEADLDIDNYQLANTVAPRSMSYVAEARSLFFATQELEPGAFPADNQERVNGTLIVSAEEEDTATPATGL